MAEPSTSGVVRDILTGDPDLPSDEVIRRARAKGLRATDGQIRKSVNNQRNPIRARVAAARVAPAAARDVAPPKAGPGTPPPAGAGLPDLSAVLANVALVSEVAGECGVENARRAAEAVRSCGGVDAFLQHLDTVARIRAAGPTA